MSLAGLVDDFELGAAAVRSTTQLGLTDSKTTYPANRAFWQFCVHCQGFSLLTWENLPKFKNLATKA